MFTTAISLRRFSACLLVCLVAMHGARAVAQSWREVQSPHFRVITDGSERDGRAVAKEFEQMRSVFALRFQNAALETGAPLLVFAVREPGLHALGPAFWKDRERASGEFFKGWEHQYAMVRLDSFGDQNQTVIFHEYTHSILHANTHWLPTWLDEGMAEFYAYTRFEGDRIFVGAPSIRFAHLQSDWLIPTSEVLTASSRTYAKDARRADLFYGEAWAMVHYMTFGQEMGGGAKLNSFMMLLNNGMPQAKAFEQTFGDLNVFERKLSIYTSQKAMVAGVLPPASGIDAKAYPARVLTPAEVEYELGSIAIAAHNVDLGREHLKAAEAADRSLAGPHEELGFLAWREGRDEEARGRWQKAVTLDPTRYRSAFALLMSGTPLRARTPLQLQDTEHALEALKLTAPKFAPIYVELALIEWRLGRMNDAYKNALVAEKLEPWRAGYNLLTGHILLEGNQPKVADEYARTVATRWFGTDHDEAVDLWNQVPVAAHGDGPALSLASPAGATVVRGTIITSYCDKGGLQLALQPDLQPDGAKALALKLVGAGRFESGFSDTLWMGEDHYTTCFHIAGLPAIVAYKADGSQTQQLLELEVRDDLPEPKKAVAVAETAKAAPASLQ